MYAPNKCTSLAVQLLMYRLRHDSLVIFCKVSLALCVLEYKNLGIGLALTLALNPNVFALVLRKNLGRGVQVLHRLFHFKTSD